MKTENTYYECHVTIEPVFDEKREQVKTIANNYNFKVAELLMKKRKNETETRSDKDTFTTGHSKDRDDLVIRMFDLVNDLKSNGFKVWRYKIEDVHLDSRYGDILSLLN